MATIISFNRTTAPVMQTVYTEPAMRVYSEDEKASILSKEVRRTGFGQDISKANNFEEILTQSGTDWTVEKVPLYLADGTRVKDAYAMQRQMDQKILAPNVSEKYVPFQNSAFAELADGLIGLGASPLKGGSFYGGRKVWYQFAMSEREISGDNHSQYLFLMASHDGSGSVMVATTLMRIACSNQINMLLRKGTSFKWTYVHKDGALTRYESDAARIMTGAAGYADAYALTAEELRGIAITDDYVSDYIDSLFPIDPEKELTERQIAGIEEKRNRLRDIYYHKDDLTLMGHNRLRLLQATSDYLSHPIFQRVQKDTAERYFDKGISGHALLQHGFNILAA